MPTAREFLRDNINTIIAAADLHDATIGDDDTYVCPAPCSFRGTPAEWEQHLAGLIADKLEPAQELTLL
jgi:hypothetical protein